MVKITPQLDLTSELFKPHKALSKSNRVCLPYPNSKRYNNLSEYYAFTFGKKGSRENELSSSKKDERDQVLERNYAWYYATLGLEYSEDEEMEEYFSRDGPSKSSVALPKKRKPTKSLPKSSKRDAFAPLRSTKVIVSKATNSGQCKKYLCYSVKNVRKRLSLRQTVDTYFEKQAKAAPSDSTLNLPDSKKNDSERISRLSDRKGKCDRLNAYDSDSSDDSLSHVVKNGDSHNDSDVLKLQDQNQLHIKSVDLAKGDAVIPVKTVARNSSVMNRNSPDVQLVSNPPSLSNSQSNLAATNNTILQNHQTINIKNVNLAKNRAEDPAKDNAILQNHQTIGINYVNLAKNRAEDPARDNAILRNHQIISIKNVNLAKNHAEDPARVLKPNENNIDCFIKSTLEKNLSAMSRNGIDNISQHLTVSKSQKSLPPANKVLQKESPKQLLNKVLSPASVKPTGFSKSSENASDCLLKPINKENIPAVFSSPTASAMIVNSKNKVISNGKLIQSDQRPSVKKETFILPNSKPKDFGMLKPKVKTRVNQENNSVAVKENIKTSSSETVLKYGAIIPNNNKLRGFKIPLKRKVLSEISN